MHRATRLPGEDLAEGLLLRRRCLVIDIQSCSPIAVPHLAWAREGDDQHRRPPVEARLAIRASGNVKGQRRVTTPACRWGLHETRADQVTVTRFKVFTGKLPLFLSHTVASLSGARGVLLMV